MGRTTQRVAMVLAGLVVVLGVGSALVWRLDGGTWENIATPSMGEVAPVGSLVFSKPTTVEALRVGDIVTFQPPNPQVTHTTTHRVVAIDGSGPGATIRTRGDINGANDPWALHTPDLRGKVEAIVWGGGWLLRAIPMLGLGLLAVWVATHYWASARWRNPLRVLGVSAVISTISTVLKPFVGAVSIGSNADAAGTHITLVSVGVLPSRFSGSGGGYVDLVDGQVATLNTQVPPEAKGAGVTGGTHMPWWLWIVMVVIWLLPMIVGLIAEARRQAAADAAGPDDTGSPDDPDNPPPDDTPTGAMVPLVRLTPRRRRNRAVATVGAMGLALLALLTTTTSAVFTAKVANTTNTAASAAYFTCTAASAAPASEYFTWPLDDGSVSSGTTARDANGSRTGKYGTGFARTSDQPCPRDTGFAVRMTGSTTNYVTTTNNTAITAPASYSVSIWFKTTTTAGGRMIGFSASQTGTSTGNRDRSIHMNPNGTLTFGLLLTANGATYPGTVNTPQAYNDGQWHQVVATWAAPAVTIYVDGTSVVSGNAPAGYTAASYTGYWRVGYDSLTNFVSNSNSYLWSGTAAWASIYTSALTAQQVSDYYIAGSS